VISDVASDPDRQVGVGTRIGSLSFIIATDASAVAMCGRDDGDLPARLDRARAADQPNLI
jgi:hypothetical protein